MSSDLTEITVPARRTGRLVSDVEILAMSDIVDILDGITEAQRGNVLSWMNRRYGPQVEVAKA